MTLLLASASPRRAEILHTIGARFEICPADIDERVPDTLTPAQAVCEISRRKAEHVLSRRGADGVLILAADTVVAVGDEILGKPQNAADASRMLHLLSGSSHAVYTGYTLADCQKIHTAYQKTEVTFRSLSEQEIAAYIQSGEPMDKAGAYGIQEKGAVFVTGIRGDYFNVMGLPVCAVCTDAKTVFGVRLAHFLP